MKAFIEKMFNINAWTIGYRKIEDNQTELPSKKAKAKYSLIPLNDHMYYADPFVFEDNENIYLFAESMNRYRGIATISVSNASPILIPLVSAFFLNLCHSSIFLIRAVA